MIKKVVSDSNPSDRYIDLQKLDTLSKVGNGRATKIIIPSELQKLTGLALGIKETLTDVKEYENKAAFPETGEADKIYVDIDTGSIYRWSGTQYIQINASVASADTAVKLATARKIAGVPFDGSADITIPAGNVGAFTKEETNTTFLSKADATTTYVAITPGKDLSDNNFTTELLTKLNGIEEGANKYILPQASSTVLGGVTVGNNITVKTGTISLSKENVIAALGFTPSDSAAEVPVEAISDTEIDKLFASTGK